MAGRRLLGDRRLLFYVAAAFIVGGVLFLAPSTKASTIYPSSTITTDTTWVEGNTYVIQHSVTVTSSAMLTVNTGVIVRFSGVYPIVIASGSALSVQGSSTDLVYFTASTTSPGYGGCIAILPNASATIANAVIAYGGTNCYLYGGVNGAGNVVQFGGTLTMSNDTIASSSHDGVQLIGGTATITSSSFSNNYYSIYEAGLSGGSLTVTSSTFSNNTSGHDDAYIIGTNGYSFESSGNTTTASGAGTHAFVLSGTFTTSTTLNPGVPYSNSGQVIVSSTALTVNPGTIVKLGNTTAIVIATSSTLNVQGSSSSPAYFTSLTDDSLGGDTNGNGNSTGTAGSAGCIAILPNASATIANAVIAYGGANCYTYGGINGFSNVVQFGGTLTMSNDTIASSSYYGLQMAGGTSTIGWSNFSHNSEGIFMTGGSLNVSESEFEGNSSKALANAFDVTSTAMAENNYWNAASGPYNVHFNASGTGDAVSDYVDFIPWLTEPPVPMSLSNLTQYKSDATTTIDEGATTTESTIVFGATLNSTSSDNLQLQVEVQPSGTGFTGIPNASSSPVSPGNFATTTFGTSTVIYPRDPESSSDGIFHWQARVRNSSSGALSDWQLYGSSSSSFVVKTVPLYMQDYGPYPSYASTSQWADELYNDSGTVDCGQPAGHTSTIAACGCTITDIVMWLRYFGIATDTNGNPVDPGGLNTWLANNSGYDANSSLYWSAIQRYASSTSGSIVFDQDSLNYDNSTSSIPSYVNPLLTSSTPDPVLFHEKAAGHWILATGLAQNAGQPTYTVRDPYWYNTQYLNETTDSSNTIKNYHNTIDNVRVYYDPPNPPRSYEYHVNLPNALMLVDSQGRRTGKDPITGVFYHEIPGTGYGEVEHSGELAVSGLPDGQYKLYVLGGQTGSYWVGAWPQQMVTGDIKPSTMDAYTLNYSATTENPKLILQTSVASAARITTAPPHNLPLAPLTTPR